MSPHVRYVRSVELPIVKGIAGVRYKFPQVGASWFEIPYLTFKYTAGAVPSSNRSVYLEVHTISGLRLIRHTLVQSIPLSDNRVFMVGMDYVQHVYTMDSVPYSQEPMWQPLLIEPGGYLIIAATNMGAADVIDNGRFLYFEHCQSAVDLDQLIQLDWPNVV